MLAPAMKEAAPFVDARQAVRFALTRTGRPGVSAITRWMGGARLAEWSQYDSAAQAGIISGMLRDLGRLTYNVLVVSSAPRKLRCECRSVCCSGWAINLPWFEAVSAITEDARKPLRFRASDTQVVIAIIARLYGKREDLSLIAKRFEVPPEVVVRYHRALQRWLLGENGIDPWAWRDADELLRARGIVSND